MHSFTDLYPGTCVLCEARCREHDLCAACDADLPTPGNGCDICGLPGVPRRCRDCQTRPPDFSAVLAALEYRFPVDILINRFKQNGRLAYGRVLAWLMIDRLTPQLQPVLADDNVIVPVPLHTGKLRSRGFNQSARLAAALAHAFRLPQDGQACCRTRAGPDQKNLPLHARSRAVAGAFHVTGDVRGKRVLLVDDVVTTCATARELAGVLTAAGADDVVILAAARTPSIPV